MKQDIIQTIIVDFREHDMQEPTFGKREIKNSLECLQGIVGGLIEIPYLSTELAEKGIDMIINEEGKLIDLKTSFLILDKENGKVLDDIRGNVIFTSHDEEGNTTSLNEEQIEYLSNHLEKNIVFFNSESESGVAFVIYA